MQAKLIQSEENFKELEKKIYLTGSESEKERALLMQKIQYYEKTIEELTKKEKELTIEVKNSKKEHVSQLRENGLKYEQMNKSLQVKVD
jgi:hypothetical protein